MDNKKVASELLKMAKTIMAGPIDDLKKAVENAKSFMDVGKALKAAKIKYNFSTSPMPIYMVKMKGTTYAIVNKKYADDADAVIGDVAIGKLASQSRKAEWDITMEVKNLRDDIIGEINIRKKAINNLKRDINMLQSGDREWERELRTLKDEQKILIQLESDLSNSIKQFLKLR